MADCGRKAARAWVRVFQQHTELWASLRLLVGRGGWGRGCITLRLYLITLSEKGMPSN